MTPRALRIQTPEGVAFTLPLASPILRALAVFIDALLMAAAASAFASAARILLWISDDFAGAFLTLAYFLTSTGYAIALEWFWGGQTLGKRLMHLRVVDAQGLRLTFPQVLIRNLLRPVDALPFGYVVGGLAAWCSPRAQRLGDLAADTVVTVVHPLPLHSADAGASSRWNSLRAHPRLAARLRRHVTPEEASLLAHALARRETLLPASRLHLYQTLAADLKQRVAFPPEITETLTDEHFLRDVLDILTASQ
jgi:uncharacterized RDD family membrane protein YckC